MTLEDMISLADEIRSTPDSRPLHLKRLQIDPYETALYYRFLYELSRRSRPKVSVELGTAMGAGAAHIAAGNPAGMVFTVDIDPNVRIHVDLLGFPNIVAVTGDSVKSADHVGRLAGDVDILLVDSLHTYEHARAEYLAYRGFVRNGGAILFDDIDAFPGVRQAWIEIQDPKAEAGFLHTVANSGFGISVKPGVPEAGEIAPPSFSHAGISMRLVEERDLSEVVRLRNDFTTWPNLTDPRQFTLADQRSWLSSIGARSGKFYFIVYDQSHPMVGMVRMDEHDPINRSIRVGADVLPEFRGKGYGRKIFQAIKKYCFHSLNIHRLWLAVLDTNERAFSLYEKEGFKVEGRQRAAVFRDGRYLDYTLMSLLAPEWREARSPARVAVVVISFNRPRMLREALKSIKGADEVVVVDDGSEFDVEGLVADAGVDCPAVSLRRLPGMTVEERASTARLGRALNAAVRDVDCDVVAYLCDDDLFHPGWIRSIKELYLKRPDAHWVKGEWGVFDDGQTPPPIRGRRCPLPQHGLATGCFAHAKWCPESCGVRWDENVVTCHDDRLIHVALPRAHSYSSIPLIGEAGWRREHAYNLLKISPSGGPFSFSEKAKEVFSMGVQP